MSPLGNSEFLTYILFYFLEGQEIFRDITQSRKYYMIYNQRLSDTYLKFDVSDFFLKTLYHFT